MPIYDAVCPLRGRLVKGGGLLPSINNTSAEVYTLVLGSIHKLIMTDTPLLDVIRAYRDSETRVRH